MMKTKLFTALLLGSILSAEAATINIQRTESGNGANYWNDACGNAFKLSLNWGGFKEDTLSQGNQGSLVTSNTLYSLNTLQFSITRAEGAETGVNRASIAIYDSKGDLVGISNEAQNGAECKSNDGMFTFNNVVLNSSETYEFRFVHLDGTTINFSETERFGYELWSKKDGSTDTADVGYTTNNTGYLPWIKLNVTQQIPEPATATLSILGLATLALRRRRVH